MIFDSEFEIFLQIVKIIKVLMVKVDIFHDPVGRFSHTVREADGMLSDKFSDIFGKNGWPVINQGIIVFKTAIYDVINRRIRIKVSEVCVSFMKVFKGNFMRELKADFPGKDSSGKIIRDKIEKGFQTVFQSEAGHIRMPDLVRF